MKAMREGDYHNGAGDPVVQVRSQPGERVSLTAEPADDHVLGDSHVGASDGDSSSCHSDQTVILRGSAVDPEQERTVKAGIFGQILVFLRTNAKNILREREIPDLAASIGQSYCARHPEVLQSCQMNIADLCSFVMKSVQEITSTSDGTPSSASGSESDAGVQPHRANRLSQVPRKPR